MPGMGIGNALRVGLGMIFIIIGVAGLFLPFLQGILMIVLGMLIIKADKVGDIGHIVRDVLKRKGNGLSSR
jgi:hypothetical protein